MSENGTKGDELYELLRDVDARARTTSALEPQDDSPTARVRFQRSFRERADLMQEYEAANGDVTTEWITRAERAMSLLDE